MSRQSNFELLRIVAMFMVLAVHSNFISIGTPSYDDFILNPISTYSRLFWEATSIVSVNLFVLISGWFGIKYNNKSFFCIFFQSFIISFISVCLVDLLDNSTRRISWIQGISTCFKWNWFIYSYALLMIISPLINKYTQTVERIEYKRFLIIFFIMQTLLDLTGIVDFYAKGYSPIYLLGIYLLGRYIRIFTPNFARYSKSKDFTIYMVCVILISLCSTFLIISKIGSVGYAYTNPLIILASVFLFLFFSKLPIKQNKVINSFAASSFSVLIFHTNIQVQPLFMSVNRHIYEHFSGINVVVIILFFMITIYLISFIIDQIRIYFWKKILHLF